MDQVLLHRDTPVPPEIPANSSWRRERRFRGASQRPETFNDSLAFDSCGDHSPGHHEFDERLKKWLSLVFGVMTCQEFAAGHAHPQITQHIAFGFDSPQYFTSESPADRIWFYQHQCLLRLRAHSTGA